MSKDVAGTVYKPFWQGFLLCDINCAITPDVLHQLYQGVFKHIVTWCQCNGISTLSKISGPERKNMAKIPLGCLIGKMPTLGIQADFNIPKFHSLQHYINSIELSGTTDNYNTEMFERLHINFAKEGWRASNQCDKFPRMIWWLSRQEKISWFQSQVPSRTPAVSPPTSSIKGKPYISIAKSANHPNCPISSVEVRHNASDFSYYLKLYLNTFTTSPASNRWLDIATTLPFSKILDTSLGPRPPPAEWPTDPLAFVEWYSPLSGAAHPRNDMMY
ncbi:hypothetical protein B0H34DRAFT_784586 [Crassisporium funariophilum]|nr:hypothetical protein B0H34DRAFT_784586 [Crassisporium funariophilum]